MHRNGVMLWLWQQPH